MIKEMTRLTGTKDKEKKLRQVEQHREIEQELLRRCEELEQERQKRGLVLHN